MPKQLTMGEWILFANEVNVPALNLPPWGGVIEWHGKHILIYVTYEGRVFTTDVSDMPEFVSSVDPTYDAHQEVWYYRLPEETMSQAWAVLTDPAGAVEQVAEVTGDIAASIATAAGRTAAAALNPVLGIPIVPIVLLAFLAAYFLPKRA